MLKRLIAVLLSAILITQNAYASPEASAAHLWERAAYGDIPGITLVNLYGFNGGVPATFEAVWPETADYIPLRVALTTPYCASTSAADDVGSTGAITIRVTGITTSFAAFSEVVTMDGQTSVTLATANILMFNGAEVLTAGSGLMNAGAIACGTGANTAGDPAVVHLFMPISSETAVTGAGNKTAQFFYGVPANHTLLCRNIQVGSVFATAAAGMQVRIEGYTNSDGIHKQLYGVHAHNTGANPSLAPGLIKIPEKTIVIGKLAGATGSNVGPASLSAECLLISNTWEATAQEIF